MKQFKAALLIAFLSIVGCQVSPTKVGETQKREFDALVDKSMRPIEISEATQILDTRSAFDYGLNHVNESQHFPFTKLMESAKSGELLRDPRKAAMRLSLLGLQPLTPVVVLGYGPKGNLDEGRLAWTLLYYGFQDVQVASVDLFRNLWTPNAATPPANVPGWSITPRTSMVIAKPEFEALAVDVKGRLQKRIYVLDVRSAKEYLSDAKGKLDIGAINIEAGEFYDKQGRPAQNLKSRLESLNIKAGDRILISPSTDGRSAAAAYALIALGYSRVQIQL